MTQPKEGCVRPSAGPLHAAPADEAAAPAMKKEALMTARVGQPAPDFEANGHFKDKFQTFKLSSFKGQWVVLCFYPGDFTFV
jgi:peroxiredoxin (alkyl hydroperoxide reductase subunit C)